MLEAFALEALTVLELDSFRCLIEEPRVEFALLCLFLRFYYNIVLASIRIDREIICLMRVIELSILL